MPTGTVKWYNAEKGFGFIARDGGGDDLFVHRTAVGYQTLGEGDRVEFTEGQGPKGPSAESVEVIERNPNPRPARGGAASPVDVANMPVETGVVDRFDSERGFGFIKRENGADVFFHHSAVSGLPVRTGDNVEFRLGEGPKGPRAEQIKVLDEIY